VPRLATRIFRLDVGDLGIQGRVFERKPHFALDGNPERKGKLINKRINRAFQAFNEVE